MPHPTRDSFTRSTALWPRLLLCLVCALVLLPAAAARAQDSAPAPAVEAPAADAGDGGAGTVALQAEAASPTAVIVPGLQAPNGLAVHGDTRRVYVTSRDNNTLFMLDPTDLRVLKQATVGSRPWGVAVDPHANRVYVANFGSGTVSVLDAADLAAVATIAMPAGAQPTFISLLPRLNRAFVANHGTNTIAVINTLTNRVEKHVKPGDTGAWGLAANPNLNRIYVTFRESATLVTLDGASGWNPVAGQTFRPCGDPPNAAPYALAFSSTANKLYVACATAGNVNGAVVYAATRDGLVQLQRNSVAGGGPDGGGGIAVNEASGNVFFTNSRANSVCQIGDLSNRVERTFSTGPDPFGVAVDEIGGRAIVGNRAANTLTIVSDPYLVHARAINGVAVNPLDGRVYMTSRDNGILIRLKGASRAVDGVAIVGRQPWGVAVNPLTDKVYVTNYADGDIRVLKASTLAPLARLAVGGQPTFVEINTATNRVFTVSHANNTLTVISGYADTLLKTVPTGGKGAWGLAVNPKLNRVYVAHRSSGELVTFDGATDYRVIAGHTISACGGGRLPYALAFNPVNDRLYVACATAGSVDTALVYRAGQTGLTLLATVPLDKGGANGGGGIAVDAATGNAFFTNSAAGTVTVVTDRDLWGGTPARVGIDPFGIAADPVNKLVYVGLRTGNNVVVLSDTGPGAASPKVFLSRQDGCEGVPLTAIGTGFLPSPTGRVQVRMDGQVVATAAVDASGSFTASFGVPGPASPGGMRKVIVSDAALPAVTVAAALRTPRTDLPVILMGGIAGSQLVAQSNFRYRVPGLLPFYWEFKAGETIWLSGRALSEALTGNDRFFDTLALKNNGLDPVPDEEGNLPDVAAGEPVWFLEPPASDPVDVYWLLYQRLIWELSRQTPPRRVYNFGYDWRKDISNSDVELGKKIDAVLAETGKDKVIIVAHSMGGIVARNYLLKRGTAKVDQVISFGTPYLGSVHPAKYLEMGDNMGMEFGPLELDPEEVKKLAQNYGGLYDMLPSRLWFNRSPFDDVYDPRYLLSVREYHMDEEEDLVDPIVSAPLDFTATKAYLSKYHNGPLVEQADRFTSTGIGDMTRLTDQYFAQRIIGINKPTMGHLWVCESPCTVCVPDEEDGWECSAEWAFAIPVLDLNGDDTVPLRSAMGSEPLYSTIQGGHYYFVDVAKSGHMALGAIRPTMNLVMDMVNGKVCINGQVMPPGEVLPIIDYPWPQATAAELASLGSISGAHLTLIGDADLEIFDASGRHIGPGVGWATGYRDSIPGAGFQAVQGAQVAALTQRGAYTAVIRGKSADAAARLKVSTLERGGMAQTISFSGIPITATTVATLTLSLPGPAPELRLAHRYTPDSPLRFITGDVVSGEAAADVASPKVSLSVDPASGLVRVAADDGAGGSGVAQVLVDAALPRGSYQEYAGPFAWPAGASCVTAVAVDRVGNSGTGRLCRAWLPMTTR